MSVDLSNNEFWVRKATAAFKRLDLDKNGFLTRDDLKIFEERGLQLAIMTPQQREVFAKRNAELIALSGFANDETKAIQFISVNSKNAGTSTCSMHVHVYRVFHNQGKLSIN